MHAVKDRGLRAKWIVRPSCSRGYLSHRSTYSKKIAFQRSSKREKAYRNMQVYPSSLNERESRYSRSCISISSGSACMLPSESRASFPLEKNLLPSGLSPNGCGGMDVDPVSETSVIWRLLASGCCKVSEEGIANSGSFGNFGWRSPAS